MSSRSSSPSILSDNDSELSSSLSKDVPEIIEGEFTLYDKNLEPVATQEEAPAFEENSVRGFFRFSPNGKNGSWLQPSYILFHVEQPLKAIVGKMFGTNHEPAFRVEIFFGVNKRKPSISRRDLLVTSAKKFQTQDSIHYYSLGQHSGS